MIKSHADFVKMLNEALRKDKINHKMIDREFNRMINKKNIKKT